ncbi:MAG: hypothetical protein N3A54_01540 [Patescibacteria group bacterium]|nr:hypothetical protein [Patescibacteria group bacterium]
MAVNFFIDDIANKKQKNEFYKKRFITVEDYPDWFLGPGLSFEEYFMDIKSWMLDLIKTNSQIAQIKCSDGTASVSLYDDEEKIEQFIICPTNNQLLPNAGITSEIEFLSPQLKEQSSPIEMATTIPESLVQKIPNYKKIVEEAARISMPKISNVCTKINNYLQKHMFQNNISTNKKSYSYSKINKKNPLLPGKKQKKEYQFQIYVIVDCSESMETSTRIWEQICEINKIFNITIVPFNSEVLVSKIQSFKQFTFTKERITFKAQGGTKIHAALNYCKDKYGLNNIFIIVSDLDFQGKINDFAKKENFIYLTDIVEGEIQYQKNEVISLCEIPNENIVWV